MNIAYISHTLLFKGQRFNTSVFEAWELMKIPTRQYNRGLKICMTSVCRIL